MEAIAAGVAFLALVALGVAWVVTKGIIKNASDRIKALEAENARLRGEIVYFLNDRSSWFNKPSGYDRLRAALALGVDTV